MTNAEKQLAVNNLVLWLKRKYAKEIMELALQHEMDVDKYGKFVADELLDERVKLNLN
jgi:hypothetical protein